MLNDPGRIAQVVNHPKFQSGDQVVLTEGPHKFVWGTFLRLKDDVEWAAIQQSDGQIRSHPVEWMQNYPSPKKAQE